MCSPHELSFKMGSKKFCALSRAIDGVYDFNYVTCPPPPSPTPSSSTLLPDTEFFDFSFWTGVFVGLCIMILAILLKLYVFTPLHSYAQDWKLFKKLEKDRNVKVEGDSGNDIEDLLA